MKLPCWSKAMALGSTKMLRLQKRGSVRAARGTEMVAGEWPWTWAKAKKKPRTKGPER